MIEPNELYHYGVLGMKWGKRKNNYHSTGIRSALARRSNEKIDKSFKKWNENSKKKANAIDLGKQMNANKLAYESDRSNKAAKSAYKSSKKAYKKALRGNTTYRKGAIRGEVGQDASRKYLSSAKKVKKQLDANPGNKQLQKRYNSLMSKHDVERAKARRAPMVGAKRSMRIASMKRMATMTVKSAATTAAVSAGLYAANKYIAKGNLSVNSQQVIDYANKAMHFMNYMY